MSAKRYIRLAIAVFASAASLALSWPLWRRPMRARTSAAGWGRPLSGRKAGIWVLSMWFFGGIITLGLLSFNLDTVQQGNALFLYLMAAIGYPGLLLVTLFFVWRFVSSLQARSWPPAPGAAS